MRLDSMSLTNDYERQFAWRDWPGIFAALPPLRDQTVVDLGCGIGDQAAELVARGAQVIGVDMNEEFVRVAQSRQLPNARFHQADLCSPLDLGTVADGLWCSFTAAYFIELPVALSLWANQLRSGGWVALTEIDNLFGHEPLGTRTRALLEAYATDAFRAKRYDFHMGRKLRGHLEESGFTITKLLTFGDRELSFDGPAQPAVIDAWRSRFDRMQLLRDFCGAEFNKVREEFLACLSHVDHRSLAKVYCCIATA